MSYGYGTPISPQKGPKGETKFGMTIGDRVEVVSEEPHFKGWHGHVRCFSERSVAVNLDEPPTGENPNGQWFQPEELRLAPI